MALLNDQKVVARRVNDVYGIGVLAAVLLFVHVGAMAVIFYPNKDALPYRPHGQLDPAQR